MKFEFELDEIDTENLFRIMHRNCMRSYTDMVEAVWNKKYGEVAPGTMRCLIDQYRYAEELMYAVFGCEIAPPMDLSQFHKYL